MSEKDLVKELKAEIVEITKDRDDALDKVKAKESRMKQVLIKLEHSTQDVKTVGHKIGEQNQADSGPGGQVGHQGQVVGRSTGKNKRHT